MAEILFRFYEQNMKKEGNRQMQFRRFNSCHLQQQRFTTATAISERKMHPSFSCSFSQNMIE